MHCPSIIDALHCLHRFHHRSLAKAYSHSIFASFERFSLQVSRPHLVQAAHEDDMHQTHESSKRFRTCATSSTKKRPTTTFINVSNGPINFLYAFLFDLVYLALHTAARNTETAGCLSCTWRQRSIIDIHRRHTSVRTHGVPYCNLTLGNHN